MNMEINYDQIKMATGFNAVCPTQVVGIKVEYVCSPLNALMELPALFQLRDDVECIIIDDECYYKDIPVDREGIRMAIERQIGNEDDPTRGDTSFRMIHDTSTRILEIIVD